MTTTIDSVFNYVQPKELSEYIALYISKPELTQEFHRAIDGLESRDLMLLVTVANLFRHDSLVLSEDDSTRVAEMILSGKMHNLRILSSHAYLISPSFSFADFTLLTGKLIELGFLPEDDDDPYDALQAHIDVYSEHIERGVPYIFNVELMEYVQQKHDRIQDILNFIRSYRSSDVHILQRHLKRSM